MTEVVARHYLDALEAVPDDPDVGQIRGQALGALIRAGERAERTGAPARAADSYTAAADLALAGPLDTEEVPAGSRSAGLLWEHAAVAADLSADWASAVDLAGRARDYHLEVGQARAAATQNSPGPQTPTAWPTMSSSPAAGACWRRYTATLPPPGPCWPDWATCALARTCRKNR